MSNTIRTFIAFDLDSKIQEAIKQIQSQLKILDCNIKWVKPKNIHLTLKFFGGVKLKEIDTLKQALADLLTHPEPIKTELTQLGAFPNVNQPQILWIWLKDKKDMITQLAKSLDEGLGKLGFKKSGKLFNPHITIGRTRSPRNIHLLSQSMSDYVPPTGLTQIFKNAILYKSILTPQGPIYESLETFKLISN